MSQATDIVRDVDGVSYTFTYLPPSKALTLMATLTKAVLAPAGTLVSSLLSGSMMDVDISQVNLAQACEKLAVNIDPEQLTSIATQLLTTVTLVPSEETKARGTIELKMDRDFRGKLPHLLKVVAVALEVNYGDFFSGLGGLAAKGKAMLSSLKGSPSAGKSGESSSLEKLP